MDLFFHIGTYLFTKFHNFWLSRELWKFHELLLLNYPFPWRYIWAFELWIIFSLSYDHKSKTWSKSIHKINSIKHSAMSSGVEIVEKARRKNKGEAWTSCQPSPPLTFLADLTRRHDVPRSPDTATCPMRSRDWMSWYPSGGSGTKDP